MNPHETTQTERAAPQYELGDTVPFGVYCPPIGQPGQRSGIIVGPGKPGEMIVQEEPTAEELAAGAVAGRRYSVWFVGGLGLVCGVGAPKNNPPVAAAADMTAAALDAGAVGEIKTEAAAPVTQQAPNLVEAKNVADRKALAILHRGPHTQDVVDLFRRLFGEAGAAVAGCPVAQPDGTCLYPAAATAEDLPALQAAINADPSATAHVMLITEPPPEMASQLGQEWPTLPAPAK